MYSHVRSCDAETVGIDLPSHLRRRGIYGCRVTQDDVETGIRESCTVHLHRLLVEVDTFGIQPQFIEFALDAQVTDKAVGVDLRLMERQFIDHHAFLQQWQ